MHVEPLNGGQHTDIYRSVFLYSEGSTAVDYPRSIRRATIIFVIIFFRKDVNPKSVKKNISLHTMKGN